MAVHSKKDKLIEDAQKFVARGQSDKAAKIYEQLLAMEPTGFNLRQKLAELLIKCGRNDDARKELETIGNHFSKNGFYLKAIAVYKQLQKLFPADISLSLILAELNAKHGLAANSLSEYKLVYEYYEKIGNIPEALSILDKMQNVDPQNIPIKVKLAEAYFQKGKKEAAYTVFAKTASLLLERGDNATLSRVCARIQQLFPKKPDFMLEILTEQLRQGNAASATDSIQNLLRSNPLNKRAWDLIVQAYQLLNQPQRVKIAFQHYLKFFPSEPEAMIGLIQSVSAENNIATTLDLLDQYESTLISAGFLKQLELIYQSLGKLDPINPRILEGRIRVATACGNDSEVSSLTSKLQSLRPITGTVKVDAVATEPAPGFIAPQPSVAPEAKSATIPAVPPPAQASIPKSAMPQAELSSASVFETENVMGTADTFQQPEEDIEIEIDLDFPFDSSEQTINADSEAAAHDNWLDSIGNLFDSINTAPRIVKFGSEMENSDAQSHFDLGQAFKEMGLYDEAINEFRQASQDPLRLVECLIMQCSCLKERGEPGTAITMLQTLLKPGLNNEEYCAIRYELASAFEYAGNTEEARILLNEISTTNPDFRDIRSRLAAINISGALDFSDDELKDF